jgi:hypothetical protein
MAVLTPRGLSVAVALVTAAIECELVSFADLACDVPVDEVVAALVVMVQRALYGRMGSSAAIEALRDLGLWAAERQ